jgi:protein-arginine kinase activator protein McsA
MSALPNPLPLSKRFEVVEMCDQCDDRPAVITIEDRDESVGYHEELNLCASCATKGGRR